VLAAQRFIMDVANRWALRIWTIVDGEPKRVDAVDRGELLLHSPQEWYRRYTSWLNILIWKTLLFFSPFYISLLLLIRISEPMALLSALIALLIVMPIMLFLLAYSAAWTLRRNGILPGLYTRGCQLPLTIPNAIFFIPHAEITDVRLRNGRFSTAIEIRYHNNERLIQTSMIREFLGDDGLALLRALVDRASSVTQSEPPRLVVYPTADR